MALVQASGAYWFSSSSYTNLPGMMVFARGTVCAAMLQCAKQNQCTNLEAAAVHFIDNFLTPQKKSQTMAAFPQIGTVGVQGSVSYYVGSF